MTALWTFNGPAQTSAIVACEAMFVELGIRDVIQR